MEPVVFALPGNQVLGSRLANRLGIEPAECEARRFPDGEEYVRLSGDIAGRDVVLGASLHRPADSAMQLLFAAEAARELGARRVGLVAPYLCYMRQDDRFVAGEAITSAYFARMLSQVIDWLVTVDPHLHRRSSLGEIYSIPYQVVPAAPDIATWLLASVEHPFLIGPDAESEQWVAAVAEAARAPFTVLSKTRRGDRDVEVTRPDPSTYRGRTPIVLDDIISTGVTMIEAIRGLEIDPQWPPLCIGTHAVFAGPAYDDLMATGIRGVATCNTIEHRTNAIDVLSRVADAAAEMLSSQT